MNSKENEITKKLQLVTLLNNSLKNVINMYYLQYYGMQLCQEHYHQLIEMKGQETIPEKVKRENKNYDFI